MPKKGSRKKKTEPSDPYIKAIESEDKEGLSKEPPQDHPCSVPRASRVAICAPPGHGKSCLKVFSEKMWRFPGHRSHMH